MVVLGRIASRMAVMGWAMWLSACTPMEQEIKPSSTSPQLHDTTIQVSDGARLPLRHWVPENPKAVIVALHGFNDYSRAFEGAGEYFYQQNMAFYAYDQRGFGASQLTGIWPGNANLIRDVKECLQLIKAQHPGAPIYLLGESMGGAVAVSAVQRLPEGLLDGMILSAPAVWGDETMNGFYRITLWLMAHTFPSSQFTGEGLEVLATDNLEILRQMGRDPLVIKETRVDAIYGIVGLMDNAYQNIDKVSLPLLVLYGARDEVIPKMPVRKALKRIKAPHTVAYYPNGYHMLLRDLKGEVVMRDIVSWVEDRYKPLPSGYDMGWREKLLVWKGSDSAQSAN